MFSSDRSTSPPGRTAPMTSKAVGTRAAASPFDLLSLPNEVVDMIIVLVETREEPIKVRIIGKSMPVAFKTIEGASKLGLANKRLNRLCKEACVKSNAFSFEIGALYRVTFRSKMFRFAANIRDYFGQNYKHVTKLVITNISNRIGRDLYSGCTMPYRSWGLLIEDVVAPGLHKSAVIRIEAYAEKNVRTYYQTSIAEMADRLSASTTSTTTTTLLSVMDGKADRYRGDESLVIFEAENKGDYDEDEF